jgi:hypothetical protein
MIKTEAARLRLRIFNCNETSGPSAPSTQKDAPVSRALQAHGQTIALPVLGGLQHRYCSI